MTIRSAPGRSLPQRGASLLFSLLALVALSLAALALVRSVDTSGLVIGNLGFKLDSTTTADGATEQALKWLVGQGPANFPATLNADNTAAGYYSTSLDALDPTGNRTTDAARVVVDWDGDQCRSVGAFSSCITPSSITVSSNNTSNTSQYLITRLCGFTGAPDGLNNSCAGVVSSDADKNKNVKNFTNPGGGLRTSTPYYRVIVRTRGGRNTFSFTETIVHF